MINSLIKLIYLGLEKIQFRLIILDIIFRKCVMLTMLLFNYLLFYLRKVLHTNDMTCTWYWARKSNKGSAVFQNVLEGLSHAVQYVQ
jgi:hypothetical protein